MKKILLNKTNVIGFLLLLILITVQTKETKGDIIEVPIFAVKRTKFTPIPDLEISFSERINN